MATTHPMTLGLLLVSALPSTLAGVSYSVPSSPPSNSSPQLNASPIGVSLEFFAFPGYFNNVQSTQQCLKNLQQLSGTWPPMRVGGTTQDRATYDPNSNQEVTYSVSSPADAPASLTFGPSFFDLAGDYGGETIIGLNRRLNNQSNTIAAANQALSAMRNLDAIELGNEPNFYSSSDPIAGGSWGATQDEASQNSWQSSVGSAINKKNVFSAGVYFGTGSYSIQNLVPKESTTSLSYVEYFCSHNYPQSGSGANLANLMSHSNINSQISQYKGEITAANNAGKRHIMGETNSATQGGGGISPTYGAALWVMDYSLQMLTLGTKALYFHQGTIGNCQYCWWGRYDMGAPYYGAYFASLALANVTKIAPLDNGSTNYAAYALYDAAGTPIKVLLYNSDYYDASSGSRSSQTFTLSGLTCSSVKASRLTAKYATSRVDQGSNPSLGGLTFANGTCNVQGTSVYENTAVVNGQASFTVAASEALLVYL